MSASLSVVAIQAAEAANDTVTTCASSGPGSLPAVVGAAAPGDTIDFTVSCPPGSPITLTSSITLASDVTIAGPGASLVAVNGNNAVQLFVVNPGVTAVISGLTMEGGAGYSGLAVDNAGTLTVSNSTFTANGGGGNGTLYNSGSLTLTNSSLINNVPDQNTGDYAGIWNDGGNATVSDTTFSGNYSYSGAGGIINEAGGTVVVSGSTFSGNSTGFSAGAVTNGWAGNGGTMTITDSTFTDNSGNQGAIAVGSGTVNIAGSTFTGNDGHGGAIDVADAATSCGACGPSGTVHVTGSTFTGNSGTNTNGGAIANGSAGGSGIVTVSNSTFTGNSVYSGQSGGALANMGGTMTVTNSSLSGNTAPGGQGDNIYNAAALNLGATIVTNPASSGDCALGSYTDLGYNIADDASCGFTATGSVNSSGTLDTYLGALADNGGPTQTMALEPGSPAIDAVADPSLCPATDQRGYRRQVPCDIGAYDTDADPATPTTPTISNLPASGTYGGGFTAVVSTNGDGTTSITSSTPSVCTVSGFSVSYIAVGTCTVTPHVTAGTVYRAASGSPVSVAVGPPAPTTPAIVLTGSALPSSPGPVTYTVTVTGSGATPTGSVAVSDNLGGSCSIPILSAGSGSCAIDETASLSPYTVTASYSGDGNYSSGTTSLTVIANTCEADATCNATVSSASQAVEVTATAGTTTAAVVITVAPAVLNCGSGSTSVAPVSTLTDSHLPTGSDLTVVDTVAHLPSVKGVAICYQPITVPPTAPGFLRKCHGAHFVAPCYKSLAEVGGSVVATLEVPSGDPRFHVGAATPSVTSYSPASAKPGHKLTIKGENLSEITGVTIDKVPAIITKTAPTSVTVTVPAGAKSGVVVVSSAAGVAVGPPVTVSAARIRLLISKPRRYEHRRR
ncbi:MAG: choice-of-anchor Q domain-containing protein [Acidimicrobiales bacterium]